MKRLIVIFFSLFSVAGFAQQTPNLGIYKVHLNTPDKSIIAEINPVGTAPTPRTDKIYYWFSSNSIKQTQGSFSGHLLNGPYKEFYLNKNLKEEGLFKKGLKTGLWKNWSLDGVLLQQVNWENGVKSGPFVLYDEKGNLKQKGDYKNNVIAPETKHKSFWNKINIFKKKDKADTTDVN
ncbi:hypothetical protein KXQ82_10405 [Mucilaginibacter sp. HMF5004]|uniref:toxin-antitoxin system YwqK family antitoxin n=1 Tax=Mucilaginibacter rivuli TaxID=2857527 RepID=UPI001C5ED87E|nr:hypothetical protein [Mucilaginibacter rivuli]MBW4890130.1 hypothetical protein [Mucilaginibacter rivuli]